MRRRAGLVTLVPLLVLLGSCTAAAPDPPDTSVSIGPGTVRVDVDGRPFALHVPASFRHGAAVPLVVILHGYTSDAARHESYFRLTAQSDARGFLYALPDGQRNRNGLRFWNATDACCDFDGSGVDDSTYLSHLISTVERSYSVDRVFLIGHSNGAFMAIRMACDHADQLTAIVGLNGAMWNDESRCRPSRPVGFLDIRGTADETIRYGGGLNGPQGRTPYPSASTTDADWRGFDHCPAQSTSPPPLDLDTSLPGTDTDVTSWSCAGHSTVESWTIIGGRHSPKLSDAFAPSVVDFMYAQAKP
jgi:polyhydroxybutyrate depolymerase